MEKYDVELKLEYVKYELRKTDYITDKLTAAIVKYVIDDDKTNVVQLYNEYKDVLTKRQQYRDEINELEAQLQAMQTAETEGESD